MAKGRSKHLYRYGAREGERRKFEREYGARRGAYVYGATVGKVRRERMARGHAERHSKGHHRGPCDGSCRAGHRVHWHR
jgi:hypothetical protein